jgi:hypothetical protein
VSRTYLLTNWLRERGKNPVAARRYPLVIVSEERFLPSLLIPNKRKGERERPNECSNQFSKRCAASSRLPNGRISISNIDFYGDLVLLRLSLPLFSLFTSRGDAILRTGNQYLPSAFVHNSRVSAGHYKEPGEGGREMQKLFTARSPRRRAR